MKLKFLFLFFTIFASVSIAQQIETGAPVPETTNEATATNSSPVLAPSTNSVTDAEPAPYSQKTKPEAPEKTKPHKPKAPPQKYGDCSGSSWIGQRIVTERHAGWGWLKDDGANWSSAKWIMIKEEPGKTLAPQRFYNTPNSDDNMQYRLYGEFADYKGYEPNVDVLVPVFVLKGFEVIGEGAPIQRKPPGPSGGKGRISERQRMDLMD